MNNRSTRVPIGLWVAALGGTGFIAGFLGPIALNPDANQGPLLGIFITGPGGAMGGAILGLLFRLLPVSNSVRVRGLLAATAALGLGTLWFCLPQPTVLGYVIDATVAECKRPAEMAKDALARWQAAVAQTTWATPPPDWQQRALANVSRDPGVVLILNIARRAAIREHRKPWDFGRTDAGPWLPAERPEQYYANDEDGSCAAYLARPRQLYLPYDPMPGSPDRPAREWPPLETTGFLSLLTLGPVPDEYRRLVEQPR